MELENWLVEEIIKKAKISREEIENLVKKKIEEFPQLSYDAALRMVATENGVIPIKRTYKVSEINSEISHIDISGIIIKKFDSRQITLKNSKSYVMNIIIGDETGRINVVIWDINKQKLITEKAKEGDKIVIVNGYSRKNKLNDMYEINVGSLSAISIEKNQENQNKDDFVHIDQIIEENKAYKTKGFITRLFTNNTFIVRCEICKKRVIDKCDIHGDKALSKTLFLSGILDDGVSSIRVTFFDKVATKLLSLSDKQDLNDKINDISFGIYQIEATGVSNLFNQQMSLTIKDLNQIDYDLIQ